MLYVSAASATDQSGPRRGYYRYPALHGDTIVFTSEGDLWSVPIAGGVARRLTSNAGHETMATISPDGHSVAFAAEYEGPTEVYTIPLTGGVPERKTWDGGAQPEAWTPDGRLVVHTERYSTLPNPQLVLIDGEGRREIVPLDGAAEAAYSADGRTLFFTRWDFQGSSTKRYQGGTAENLWRFDGSGEAVALTADYAGTSHNPLYWNGRVYFLSDRDGVMNVYSMDPHGKDLRQESHQKIFDIDSATVDDGRLVYACGADLWRLDLETGREEIIPVALSSDFDQLREHWVYAPGDYLTAAHLSPDGGAAVFTARGEVFTIPAKTGRIVKIAGNSAARYRDATFTADGTGIIALSTETGETEFWKYPANGVGSPEQWTRGAKVMRDSGVPSPDGRWLAHSDKDQQLWLYDVKTKQTTRIAQSMNGGFDNLRWSPDSRWLAYEETADNDFVQIKILNAQTGELHAVTSDRYDSIDATWSADGKWLYFLSDRMLKTTVRSPWGPRQPEPHFDRAMKIYQLALTAGLRSPFLPADELHPDKDDGKDDAAANAKTNAKGKANDGAKTPPEVKIDFTDLAARLTEVPVPSGNYDALQAPEKRLCWQSASDEVTPKAALQCLDIANKGDEPDTLLADVKDYEVSLNRKKMLVHKGRDFLVLDADARGSALADPKALGKATINLSRWKFSTNPREEFRGIFLDAWQLERDYFYDRHMHGVDWNAARDRYLPLVDRVSDRDELNAVIAQMVSELSALHTFVRGGDMRKPADQIDLATLGARLRRDDQSGGYVVEHVYRHDPDLPERSSPLARPESRVHDGEVIEAIDGVPLRGVADERELLRGKVGVQVLLHVKAAGGAGRDVLVMPIKVREEADLRYAEWEYTRRLQVDEASHGKVGYVHLQAMGAGDMDQWAREFYPVYDREGLIIDVRHNQGGNIDSWLLGKLLRQAWLYWQPRVGKPSWGMQSAFRGHMVVLCDQDTASDGEAFSEGFRRLKLGSVVGTRTWGGEIWLRFDNFEADGGIASAAEIGVYGPEGKWLIEGRGVEPDIVVDNLPHATFAGADAQLQAALDLLDKEIKDDPRPVPKAPPYPDKSFQYPR